jgi:selenocysteine lyase/cysteine desulfurase
VTARRAKTLEPRPPHAPHARHAGPGAAHLDVQRLRSEFPIVDQKVSGKPLIALDKVHPHDIGSIRDRQGVALRARASLGCNSTRQDTDALMAGLEKVNEAFR